MDNVSVSGGKSLPSLVNKDIYKKRRNEHTHIHTTLYFTVCVCFRVCVNLHKLVVSNVCVVISQWYLSVVLAQLACQASH